LSLESELRNHPQDNLAILFRTNKAIRKLRHTALTQEWNRLVALISDDDCDVEPEEGACLIASWHYWKDLSIKERVYATLDDHADSIRERLLERFPVNPSPDSQEDISWDPRAVLDEVNIFFKENNFEGNVKDYYQDKNRYSIPSHTSLALTNLSFLNDVLERKTGIPICNDLQFRRKKILTLLSLALSVVYAAICRRLGVHLELIGMPGMNSPLISNM